MAVIGLAPSIMWTLLTAMVAACTDTAGSRSVGDGLLLGLPWIGWASMVAVTALAGAAVAAVNRRLSLMFAIPLGVLAYVLVPWLVWCVAS